MRSKILKITGVVLLSIIISSICITILDTIYFALEPYYSHANNQHSEDAIFEILKEEYPNAYYPYKNLDYMIGNYEEIEHIYKLNFPQKLPKYVYNVTERNLSSSYSFLIVFNALGSLENIIFLDNHYESYNTDVLSTNEIINEIRGQKATSINLSSEIGTSIESNFIVKGVKTASKNFIYEVQTK